MRTVLDAEGRISLPDLWRQRDGLTPGDRFELERIGGASYLLTRQSAGPASWSIGVEEDGLPVIIGMGPLITTQMVREIDDETG